MRSVSLTRHEFDNYLFPAWANAQNPGDPELVVRVTRKLKSVSLERPLSEMQQKLREGGNIVFADRTLTDEEADLWLEEDEWRVVKEMFQRSLGSFVTLAMEDAVALNDKLKAAKLADVEVTPGT